MVAVFIFLLQKDKPAELTNHENLEHLLTTDGKETPGHTFLDSRFDSGNSTCLTSGSGSFFATSTQWITVGSKPIPEADIATAK